MTTKLEPGSIRVARVARAAAQRAGTAAQLVRRARAVAIVLGRTLAGRASAVMPRGLMLWPVWLPPVARDVTYLALMASFAHSLLRERYMTWHHISGDRAHQPPR